MKQGKTISLLAIGAASALVLAGCAAAETETETDTTPQPGPRLPQLQLSGHMTYPVLKLQLARKTLTSS